MPRIVPMPPYASRELHPIRPGRGSCIVDPLVRVRGGLDRWLDLVAAWVAERPTADHPAGLSRVREAVGRRLDLLGFSVHVREDPGGPSAPVLVAERPPEEGERW